MSRQDDTSGRYRYDNQAEAADADQKRSTRYEDQPDQRGGDDSDGGRYAQTNTSESHTETHHRGGDSGGRYSEREAASQDRRQSEGQPTQRRQDRAPDVRVEQGDSSSSLLTRGLYFVLVGWWASGVWLSIAWLLNCTIVLMPLGIKMINKTPKIVSLKDQEVSTEVVADGDQVTVTQSNKEQRSLLVRGVYFLTVGWWASALWMGVAWIASVTIVGLPVAVWMYDRLPFVVSLYRY